MGGPVQIRYMEYNSNRGDQQEDGDTVSPQTGLRRRHTIRFARKEPADCPVHGSIVTCDISLECPGHVKIG